MTSATREEWRPALTDEYRVALLEAAELGGNTAYSSGRERKGQHDSDLEVASVAAIKTMFHARDIWTDDELAERLAGVDDGPFLSGTDIDGMLAQLGERGRELLKRRQAQAKKKVSEAH
jgi:hypothetical protein